MKVWFPVYHCCTFNIIEFLPIAKPKISITVEKERWDKKKEGDDDKQIRDKW